MFARLLRRLRALLRRSHLEDELDTEMRFHLEKEIEKNLQQGMTAEEARRAALATFGGVERFKEEARDVRGVRRLEEIGQDLRHAARVLRRTPALTAVALLTLALGIGANTAIFSLVDALVLRPLPFPQPDGLVAMPSGVMLPDFVDVRVQSRSFQKLAAYRVDPSVLTGPGEPESIDVVNATPELFDVLGVRPALGRGFSPQEDVPGRVAVAVVSSELWQRKLGADPAAIGRTLSLDGRPLIVAGVMPPGFQFPIDEQGGDLWVAMPTAGANNYARQWRGFRALRCIGRLAPGMTLAQAQAEVGMIAARLAQEHPRENAGRGFSTIASYDGTVKVGRPALLVLLGAVALVLLIACANVANLQLIRARARRREMAVRAALGAGRGRIIRQLLTEGLLLAMLGGALGLLLAYGGVQVLAAAIPADVPRLHPIGFQGRVLLYTLAAALATAVLVGLAPALSASQANLHSALKEGERGTGAARGRTRSALLVGEIALAMVLLVGAGLLVRSFARVTSVDPGFDPRGLLVARLKLPPGKDFSLFYRELQRGLEALPGTMGATIGAPVPYARWFSSWNFTLDDRPEPPPDDPWWTNSGSVSAGYHRLMGIRVLQGRQLQPADEEPGAPQVAVVNETFARRFWLAGNAIGHQVRAYEKNMRIVGVVADTRGSCGYAGCSGTGAGRLDRLPDPEIQIPLGRWGARTLLIVVRAAASPTTLIGPLRLAVKAIDSNAVLTEMQTMDQAIDQSLGQRRLVMSLLALFAVLAVVLAAVGIYGVTSYSVTQRTREIGVRMALGAHPANLQKMVVGQGLRLALLGLLIGFAAALALTRLVASQLYGVSATDPATFAGLAVLLLGVSVVAALLPARRATRVNPMTALRDG